MKNELKVLKNHDWYTEVHPEKENYVFKVEETGIYDVTIQFNANNFEINVKTTKTGDAVIGEKTWTVVGFKAILGKKWDQTAIENDMIKQEDNVTYILTKTNLTLALGTYKYKICANHGWAENYGDNNDSEGNAFVFITRDGIYDLTFTFNQATKEVSATAVPSVTDGISQIASDIKTKKVTSGTAHFCSKTGSLHHQRQKSSLEITNTYHSNHQKGIHQHRECLFLDNFPRFFRIFHL